MRCSFLEDPDTLEALRREALALLGPAGAARMLYARGFAEGALEALRQAGDFSRMDLADTGWEPGFRPLILVPEGKARETGIRRLQGNRCSPEARARDPELKPASHPSCFATAGFSSGWYSAWLNQPVILQETQCVSAGDPACCFEPHRTETAEDDSPGNSANEILANLDVAAILHWAREKATFSEEDEYFEASGSLPGLDLSAPGVHLWGPVMVLPYAGALAGELALNEIEADLGPGQVEVVVLDLAGAGTDGIEAAGIAQLLTSFEASELDVILTGLSSRSERALRACGVDLPLTERDLGSAVASGFRFARARQYDH